MRIAEYWHKVLSTGHPLDAELDTDSRVDVFALINVVSGVLLEMQFREITATRTRRILRELLNNVAQHVEIKSALVKIEIHKDWVRGIEIDVFDRGPGP